MLIISERKTIKSIIERNYYIELCQDNDNTYYLTYKNFLTNEKKSVSCADLKLALFIFDSKVNLSEGVLLCQ